MAEDTPSYTSEDMQVLEGLEAVRKRPGMYIGSTDSKGLNHLIWEIVDNAVDESLAGHATDISINLLPDGSIQVADNGRGIPTTVNKKVGLTGVEIAYMKLHGGGKFGGSGYKSAGGLHGVGASVVNALSVKLDVTVYRDGKKHDISFKRGESGIWDSQDDTGKFTRKAGLVTSSDTRKAAEKKARPTGTVVRWWADKSIFIKGSIVDIESILTRARQTAFLVPTLAIHVKDERDPANIIEESFKFEGGITDMVDYISPAENLHPIINFNEVGTFKETVPVLDDNGNMVDTEVEREVEVHVAFAWNQGYDTVVKSFVNVVNTPNGGTHVKGFESAISKAFMDSIKNTRGLLKAKEEPPVLDDFREGLTAVVYVNVQEPQFIGQTKDELGTAGIRNVVRKAVLESLNLFIANKKNATAVKTIGTKIVEAARIRLSSRQEKDVARKKSALETSTSLPSKLVECADVGDQFSELHICEGDSALGTMKSARDSSKQALFPIRGKILNVQKATVAAMLGNSECADLIQIIGAGSGRNFELELMRYHNICIAVDADLDGNHIRTLLITYFWKYMRPLVEAGRLYATMPPLYVLKTTGKDKKIFYLESDEARDKLVADLNKRKVSYSQPQRFKGLGEMDADEFWDTTLNPETRSLRQVTVPDAVLAESMLELAMGNKVEPRKDWIMESRRNISDDDLDI